MTRALRKVKIVFFDFDGVFTDNRVWVNQDGIESVACNRSDGLGIGLLKTGGWQMAIVSTERNPVVHRRAEKLALECFAPCENKIAEVSKVLDERGLTLSDAAFVGNDINDLSCLEVVGLSVAVQDAYPEAKAAANLVLKRKGGHGAVREFCDLLVAANGGKLNANSVKSLPAKSLRSR